MQFAIGFPSVAGGYFGATSETPTAPKGFHPIDPEFYGRDFVANFASAAVESGFSAIHFTEHPIPSVRWLDNGGHEAVDPLVALAFLAGIDADIQLLTQLTVLPYRNPFLFAKSAASLDRLSGGRLILGVGTGYLKTEFHALGVDFDERNPLFDEALAVCRLAWKGDAFSYEGRHFSARDVRSLPTPIQETIPVWIGGNAKVTRRRVAESAQGWLPQPNPASVAATRRTAVLETLNDLELMLTDLREYAASIGRTEPIDVMYTSHEGGLPGSSEWDSQRRLADLQAQASLGVTWHHTNPIGSTPAQVLNMVRQYGDEVVSPLR
jgi:probable F420-dependent oxidoreductase